MIVHPDETSEIAQPIPLAPLAVHLHVHYLETLPALLQALEKCQDGLDDLRLWISTDSSEKAELIEIGLQDSCLSKKAVFKKVRVSVQRRWGCNGQSRYNMPIPLSTHSLSSPRNRG